MRLTKWAIAIAFISATGCGNSHKTSVSSSVPAASATTVPLSPSVTVQNIASTTTDAAAGPFAPTLEVPAGVALCAASDLEFHPGAGLGLLRFFNRRGQACGLAGYPTLSGRTPSGGWDPIPATPLLVAPTNGPRWTGIFEIGLVAVISIRDAPESTCIPRQQTTRYPAIRLTLPNRAGNLDIETPLDYSACPLQITPFTADSQDR